MDIAINATRVRPGTYAGDLVVHFVREREKKAPVCADPAAQAAVERAFAAGDFTGKEGQVLLHYPDPGKAKRARRLLVVGLGKEEPSMELFRVAGGQAVSAALRTKARTMLVAMPGLVEAEPQLVAQGLTEGLLLGAYRFRKYRTRREEGKEESRLAEIFLAVSGAAARHGLDRGRLGAAAVWAARDMAHEPANFWTPLHFAEHGRQLAQRTAGLSCRVIDKNGMKKLGMGGILGVNRGSAEPPTLTILEYRTGRKVPTLLLVGKGLTFDSGGLSLKPAAGMHEMKYDMSGGAAVLALMQALGEEPPRNLDVVAMIPATENLVGPAALMPGDVVTIYGGKTVEVVNTDAEGRLIMADALAYGVAQYRPAYVVDIATLTGAVIIGLGHHRTGLLANDDRLAERIATAGAQAGEPLWRLPMGPEYTKQLKSEIADLKNVDKRDAGTILAACFLQEFVGKTPWAHLDIAGTAWDFTEKSYIPKGPSGVGVRTLLELVRNWK